ncbi:GNAT family N-acetyltransferase [Litchfieldia alkalitelluris]|uniref:GNAT family N-acetyltransferase n=1 Tax=Litchfieldia alkalitelluris TaxID=304268 RepID=UPI000998593C|nr:GNAT family N-acetyltransferase [Litchfieldia alkalitelluris]
MLTLKQYTDVSSFKNEVSNYLEQFEVENNLLLGILSSLKETDTPIFMATVIKDVQIVMVMLQTHPNQIILSHHTIEEVDEIKKLAEELTRAYPKIPGLIGEAGLTKKLANDVANLSGSISKVKMNQRIYRLNRLEKNLTENGVLMQAAKEHYPIIKEWVYGFAAEVDMKLTQEEAEKRAIEFIEKGRLYVWIVKGKMVSMAAATRPTKTNITINLVYTPKEERKKGHASNCVLALTTKMLNQGYYSTSLYTDLENPTSNKIYMEIGYKPIMDSVVVHFNQ